MNTITRWMMAIFVGFLMLFFYGFICELSGIPNLGGAIPVCLLLYLIRYAGKTILGRNSGSLAIASTCAVALIAFTALGIAVFEKPHEQRVTYKWTPSLHSEVSPAQASLNDEGSLHKFDLLISELITQIKKNPRLDDDQLIKVIKDISLLQNSEKNNYLYRMLDEMDDGHKDARRKIMSCIFGVSLKASDNDENMERLSYEMALEFGMDEAKLSLKEKKDMRLIEQRKTIDEIRADKKAASNQTQ